MKQHKNCTNICGLENTIQVKNDRKQNRIKMAIILTSEFHNIVKQITKKIEMFVQNFI